DGQRGDDDGMADGVITDPGGPAFVTTPVPPEATFVTALYRTLLARDPEPAGLAFWIGLIDHGATRLQVSQGIYDSQEHRGILVDELYATYLKRTADLPGRVFWIQALAGGLAEQDVALRFLLSPEYTA